jgi:hypothetical protein
VLTLVDLSMIDITASNHVPPTARAGKAREVGGAIMCYGERLASTETEGGGEHSEKARVVPNLEQHCRYGFENLNSKTKPNRADDS